MTSILLDPKRYYGEPDAWPKLSGDDLAIVRALVHESGHALGGAAVDHNPALPPPSAVSVTPGVGGSCSRPYPLDTMTQTGGDVSHVAMLFCGALAEQAFFGGDLDDPEFDGSAHDFTTAQTIAREWGPDTLREGWTMARAAIRLVRGGIPYFARQIQQSYGLLVGDKLDAAMKLGLSVGLEATWSPAQRRREAERFERSMAVHAEQRRVFAELQRTDEYAAVAADPTVWWQRAGKVAAAIVDGTPVYHAAFPRGAKPYLAPGAGSFRPGTGGILAIPQSPEVRS